MESEKLSVYQKVLFIIGVVLVFFVIGKKASDLHKSEISSATEILQKETVKMIDRTGGQTFSKHSFKLKEGYIVVCMGKPIDKTGKIVEDEINISVSKISLEEKENEGVNIRLVAISNTAKEEINTSVVNLPELVYQSVQNVADKVTDLRSVKTKRGFDVAIKKYKKSLDESNNLVSLHGFQIIEEPYTLEGGEVLIK